jgi:hypothetical protein
VSPWASQLIWDVARAGGFAAYVLLALAVLLGLALSLRLQDRRRWPRFLNYELHRHLTLLALVFTAVHVAAVAVDPFTAFRLVEVLVPGASHYRPLWMGMGIVAADLGLAVGLSSLVERLIGHRLWRMLHHLAFVVFALATAHGLGTGSDTRTAWAEAVYAGAGGLVWVLTFARLATAKTLRPLARAGALGLAFALLVGGVAGALLGPLRPGWNAIANNGHGSGARLVATRPASPPPTTFTASVAGASAFTDGALVLTGDVQGTVRGRLRLDLAGELAGDAFVVTGGTVELTETWPSAVAYQGPVDDLRGGRLVATVRPAGGGPALTLVLDLTVDPGTGAFQGDITAQPGS